jgi:hypothetical protein
MFSPDSPSTTDLEDSFNRGREEEASRERFDSRAYAAFEQRAVRHVLNGLGMAASNSALSRQARELTGDPSVSFALLHHLVPDFPIRLGVAKLFYLKETLTLESLFRQPEKNQVYRAFHEWAEEDPTDDDRHRGIIFRLPGCPGVGNRAILHTYPVPVEAEQTRVTFGVREGRTLVIYTLEPLDQLLKTLKRLYRGNDYQ